MQARAWGAHPVVKEYRDSDFCEPWCDIPRSDLCGQDQCDQRVGRPLRGGVHGVSRETISSTFERVSVERLEGHSLAVLLDLTVVDGVRDGRVKGELARAYEGVLTLWSVQ